MEVFCGLVFGALLLAALVYAIRQGLQYYRVLPDFYTSLQREDARGAAAALCHPAWLLLPFVPFKGTTWLNTILADAMAAGYFPSTETEDPQKMRQVKLTGGDSILIEEQHERGSGMAESARVYKLMQHSYLVSRSRESYELSPGQISVYTARHLDREWASLEQSGNAFYLRPIDPDAACLIKSNGCLELCPSGESHSLISGDRFVLGISEFEFLQLPFLALLDEKNAIICKNVEDVWTDERFPEFEICHGRLIAQDYSFYRSAIPAVSLPASPDGILLQPGDRLEFDDGRQLHLHYLLNGGAK